MAAFALQGSLVTDIYCMRAGGRFVLSIMNFLSPILIMEEMLPEAVGRDTRRFH